MKTCKKRNKTAPSSCPLTFVKRMCNQIFHLVFHILLSANELQGCELIFSDSPSWLQPRLVTIITAGCVNVLPINIQHVFMSLALKCAVQEIRETTKHFPTLCWYVQAHMAHYSCMYVFPWEKAGVHTAAGFYALFCSVPIQMFVFDCASACELWVCVCHLCASYCF